MKYRIAIQLALSLCCVVITGLILRWWAILLWVGVFLYLASAMELVYRGARALAIKGAGPTVVDAISNGIVRIVAAVR